MQRLKAENYLLRSTDIISIETLKAFKIINVLFENINLVTVYWPRKPDIFILFQILLGIFSLLYINSHQLKTHIVFLTFWQNEPQKGQRQKNKVSIWFHFLFPLALMKIQHFYRSLLLVVSVQRQKGSVLVAYRTLKSSYHSTSDQRTLT